MSNQRLLNWFEIPVTDLTRATQFYQQLLDTTLRSETCGPAQLAVFEYAEPNTGGCLYYHPEHQPQHSQSAGGVLIYLNCAAGIDSVLARLENLGGAILTPKTTLPDNMGYFAVMRDSEGNAVGLHSAT
ncbi:VOC family protein [Parvibium lacunae]|uniref:VOC family protein n=1 Tax=Parvibium lacunae TaxID=1888893 RepID=A0A368L728_9BURK|nr:VOC family protein [Parvibium lacunae]RCS59453.1 VOC family protein [Parvibium lacunae]